MVRRTALTLLAAAASLLPGAAAQAQAAPAAPAAPAALRNIEVDRIVAVVGTTPVLFSEVLEQLNYARANGRQIPPDSAGQIAVARQILNEMVDQEILVTLAREYKIEVPETEVSDQVEKRIADIRQNFQTEQEYRAALLREGFGTPEEYRRRTVEQAIRSELQKRAVDSLKAKGRLAPANVTESEVAAAFERLKTQLGRRPATLAFRQIVVPPAASASSVLRARTLADSLRAALEKGADFDSLARRFSMDGSAQQGGDLGWNRRGVMVPEFERMMFALPPGRISPVVETQFGFHVIRVDRVRAAEVRARHILIRPTIDSTDVRYARQRADSALALWKSGVPFDTLVARFHDAEEERTIPEGYPRDSLPAEYRVAFRDLGAGDFTGVFALADPQSGFNKWAVAQVISVKAAGEWTLAEYQERVRAQLREERSIRRTLDKLRTEFYVSLRL
ncbi:MAG: peptidylprolyl isomerase [Gemmatimonadales bacterium]|nr:peptidylprolyl isomerase [Gemmatimonadota bacterium]MCL4214518.1 peptidylprolyl isomerase [Gemmatimonadales bacterium]